jgi:hypothetical protein
VVGRGVKPRDVERAISLSMTRYCSAVASLTAEVEHTYRIVEDEIARGHGTLKPCGRDKTDLSLIFLSGLN